MNVRLTDGSMKKVPCPFQDPEGHMCTVPLGGYATEADFSQETLQLIYAGKGTEKDYEGWRFRAGQS